MKAQPRRGHFHLLDFELGGQLNSLKSSLAIAAPASIVFLAACGSPDVRDEDAAAAEKFVQSVEEGAQTERTMADGAGDRPMNGIESITFSQSGNVETVHEFELDDLSLTGGCVEGEGIGFMFSDNSNATGPTYFMVSLQDDASPKAGETGSFPIEKITWTNGKVPHPELSGIMLPNTLEGSGELAIKEHKGGGMNGRMVAKLTGDVVEKDSGAKASITVDYDIYWGCKTSPANAVL